MFLFDLLQEIYDGGDGRCNNEIEDGIELLDEILKREEE